MMAGAPEAERSDGFPLPGAGRTPSVTYALLAAIIVTWLASFVAGGNTSARVLLRFGAMFGPLIANGQYWRLFTALFVHVGLLHIFFNGFALLVFGRLAERFFGHARFAAIYVLGGLVGSVASYVFNAIAVAAGASGAIFGLVGALAAFFLVQRTILGSMGRRTLYGLLILAALNLYLGTAMPGIDNWAHLGGFVAGFALGLPLSPRYRPLTSDAGVPVGVRDANSLLRRWWVVPVALALVAAGTALGTATLPDNAESRVYSAQRLYAQQRYDAALQEVSQALALDPLQPEAYYLRGRILADLGDRQGARASLARAVEAAARTGDEQTRVEALRLLVQLTMN